MNRGICEIREIGFKWRSEPPYVGCYNSGMRLAVVEHSGKIST